MNLACHGAPLGNAGMQNILEKDRPILAMTCNNTTYGQVLPLKGQFIAAT